MRPTPGSIALHSTLGNPHKPPVTVRLFPQIRYISPWRYFPQHLSTGQKPQLKSGSDTKGIHRNRRPEPEGIPILIRRVFDGVLQDRIATSEDAD